MNTEQTSKNIFLRILCILFFKTLLSFGHLVQFSDRAHYLFPKIYKRTPMPTCNFNKVEKHWIFLKNYAGHPAVVRLRYLEKDIFLLIRSRYLEIKYFI